MNIFTDERLVVDQYYINFVYQLCIDLMRCCSSFENTVKGENTEVPNVRKQIGKMNEATTQVDSFVRLAPSGLFSGIVLPRMTSWRLRGSIGNKHLTVILVSASVVSKWLCSSSVVTRCVISFIAELNVLDLKWISNSNCY